MDYRPQKLDPNRVRITVRGNLIAYLHEVTRQTVDFVAAKILWSNGVSTLHAKYLCADVTSFCLNTPMERFEYTGVPRTSSHNHSLMSTTISTYMEIRKAYIDCHRLES